MVSSVYELFILISWGNSSNIWHVHRNKLTLRWNLTWWLLPSTNKTKAIKIFVIKMDQSIFLCATMHKQQMKCWWPFNIFINHSNGQLFCNGWVCGSDQVAIDHTIKFYNLCIKLFKFFWNNKIKSTARSTFPNYTLAQQILVCSICSICLNENRNVCGS